jgi:hypothetical protein
MALPPLYARWLDELHGAPMPEEPLATCSSCPMTRELLQDHRFSPATKCCTFFPDLPSFAVGGALVDDHPGMAEGKRRLLERIAGGQQVTPLGVSRPGIFLRLYGRGETFGVQPALRCPYYVDEGGLCGVWRHRESTCATWFCKHERGVVGLRFWNAHHRLLKGVEQCLSMLIAVDLGIEREGLDVIFASGETVDREQHPDVYRALWGEWRGREVDYYAECARRVAAMSWADVMQRAAGSLDDKLAAARETRDYLMRAPQLPDLVRIRPLRRAGVDGKQVLLKSYSDYNPVEVPAETADALATIGRGRVSDLVAEGRVDRALLERLWEFGLIEDASE